MRAGAKVSARVPGATKIWGGGRVPSFRGMSGPPAWRSSRGRAKHSRAEGRDVAHVRDVLLERELDRVGDAVRGMRGGRDRVRQRGRLARAHRRAHGGGGRADGEARGAGDTRGRRLGGGGCADERADGRDGGAHLSERGRDGLPRARRGSDAKRERHVPRRVNQRAAQSGPRAKSSKILKGCPRAHTSRSPPR